VLAAKALALRTVMTLRARFVCRHTRTWSTRPQRNIGTQARRKIGIVTNDASAKKIDPADCGTLNCLCFTLSKGECSALDTVPKKGMLANTTVERMTYSKMVGRPAGNSLCPQLFLSLSRARLGKFIIFSHKMTQKRRFSHHCRRDHPRQGHPDRLSPPASAVAMTTLRTVACRADLPHRLAR
jgi:hypothetical protein